MPKSETTGPDTAKPIDPINLKSAMRDKIIVTKISPERLIKENGRYTLPFSSKYSNKAVCNEFQDDPEVLAKCQTQTPAITKRIEHAMQYLRRKGLLKRNMAEVLDMARLDPKTDMIIAMMTAIIANLVDYSANKDITDESYEKAIELTMVECEPAIFIDEGLYSRFLDAHIGILYANVILIAYANEVAEEANSQAEQIIKMQKWLEEDRDGTKLIDEINKTKQYNADTYIEQVAELTEQHAQNLAQTEEKYKDTITSLRRELKELRKSTQPIQQENRRLANQLEAETNRATELAGQIKELKAAIAEKDRFVSNLLNIAQIDDNLPELPETGVVIVGGHSTLTSAMKTQHPHWKYVEPGEKNAPAFPNATCIFVITNFVSHSVIEHVQRVNQKNIPILYLNFRGVERVEQEIRQAYAAMITKQNNQNN